MISDIIILMLTGFILAAFVKKIDHINARLDAIEIRAGINNEKN